MKPIIISIILANSSFVDSGLGTTTPSANILSTLLVSLLTSSTSFTGTN